MPDPQMHQIGEAAGRSGLSLRTVRYYEEVGLVVPSGRTEGGFRLYTDADIERLGLIRQLKPLDFSLEELGELLATRDQLAAGGLPDEEQEELRARLRGYVAAARERCTALRRQLEQLESVTRMLAREVDATSLPAAPPQR